MGDASVSDQIAWFWLIVCLYLAYSWLSSGFGKLTNPAWSQTGEALMGFWAKALGYLLPKLGTPWAPGTVVHDLVVRPKTPVESRE